MSAGDACLRRLQSAIGHCFANESLLRQALTHRSFSTDNNERLEFLGDSVLGLAIAHLLYEKLHGLPEGDLSRVRAKLVRQDSLHALALQIGLADALRLGGGEQRAGGRSRPSILADALEAVIGAVYLDGGYDAARAVVLRLFRDVQITPDLLAAAKDAKTALQEWLQARRMQLPRYEVLRVLGEAHRQTFEVACEVPEMGLREQAQAASRRAAELLAAAAMLKNLQTSAKKA